MSHLTEELMGAFVDLLRQGPPFLGLLAFARRCVDENLSPSDLIGLHSPTVGGVDFSMAETLLTIVASYRTLLLQLQDRQREVEDLEYAHRDLARLLRTKSSTLSMVAHDLSNYLVSSRILALSMVRDTHEDLVRDRCRYILKVLEDQEHLVANLLSIGKIEAGIPSAYPDQVADLKAVIVRCVESARKMTGHPFSVRGPALQVRAQEDKIRQILENLVGNAVKFSPRGGLVEIETSVQDQRAVVEVRDHGIGIEKGDMPHLFEPYYRAVDGQTGGTGLGLSIVKSLLELLAGDIRIESDTSGTTVRFSLPLAGLGSFS